MANGDPVTQKQFYETIEKSNGKVLKAIGEVDKTVNDLRVDVKEVATIQGGQETRIKSVEDAADGQKNWNRGLAAVEGLLAVVLAAVGIGRE